MNRFARWSLGIGIVMIPVTVALSKADAIIPTVITGALAFSGIVLSVQVTLDEASSRWRQRRDAKKARRTVQNR